MDTSIITITVKLRGIRPLMFDRYPGDNKTKLDPLDKIYLNEQQELCLPTTAIYSLLAARNTGSVSKYFAGKQQKAVSTAILAFCQFTPIHGDDPFLIPLRDEEGKPYLKSDPRIKVYDRFIGKTKDGTPNENSIRPAIPKGWSVDIAVEFIENEMIQLSALKKMFEQGGILGLGTFRPVFGRYYVEQWEEK